MLGSVCHSFREHFKAICSVYKIWGEKSLGNIYI